MLRWTMRNIYRRALTDPTDHTKGTIRHLLRSKSDGQITPIGGRGIFRGLQGLLWGVYRSDSSVIHIYTGFEREAS
jgi:hypothetical protein